MARAADPLDPVRLAPEVVRIARAAGSEILRAYQGSNVRATSKSDASPLTEADLCAHRAIVEALSLLTPGIAILSEESSSVPFATRRAWSQYWLVDPLDGTKEFLSRNGEFTVNIALIVDHDPVLGVVGVPARDTVYWGAAGQGAHRAIGSGAPVQIKPQSQAASPVRVVGSRSHRGDSLDAFLVKVGPHELIPVGSALKFCLVAEGSADIYPRLGPTSEWDTAAAHGVVVAAGGVVIATSGAPLRYNTKADLLNPNFLVYADRSRDWLSLL
ncbi:MAG: 3'(2'),5'-bisphosphate nucleotidase CysQ [Steroidobacteraceae bacterium]